MNGQAPGASNSLYLEEKPSSDLAARTRLQVVRPEAGRHESWFATKFAARPVELLAHKLADSRNVENLGQGLQARDGSQLPEAAHQADRSNRRRAHPLLAQLCLNWIDWCSPCRLLAGMECHRPFLHPAKARTGLGNREGSVGMTRGSHDLFTGYAQVSPGSAPHRTNGKGGLTWTACPYKRPDPTSDVVSAASEGGRPTLCGDPHRGTARRDQLCKKRDVVRLKRRAKTEDI